MTFRFELLHNDNKARRGRMHTAHGVVETPVFMAVGTQATVKGLTPQQLDDAGVQVLLGNTYHLTLRPGDEADRRAGRPAQFMGWSSPSSPTAAAIKLQSRCEPQNRRSRRHLRSHIDGALLELTPEKAMLIQQNLGSDIAMCLDECPPFETPAEYRAIAVERTLAWAERCKAAHCRADQALFAIVQGGTDIALRIRCANALTKLDFPGYALGGFAVGETMQQMTDALEPSADALPADKPRYLMGVGTPIDLLQSVARGIDMFDCVMPTRNARNATAFTMDASSNCAFLSQARSGPPGVRLPVPDVPAV